MSLNTDAHSGSTKPVAVAGRCNTSVAPFTIAGNDASELRVPMATTCDGISARAKSRRGTRRVMPMTLYSPAVAIRCSTMTTMK